MTRAATGASPVPLRRNRDFALLWSGQVVSTVGSEMSALAFPLLVLGLTGSARDAGIVGFARSLPFLLVYLPAGVYVDRWNRKHVMLAADAGRALALGSVAVWLALGRPPLAWLAVASAIEGCLFVFFQLSESAALPAVVPKEQLPQAIAQNQARMQGAGLVGSPLGGALYGLSRLLPFAVDAVSYAVSFVSLLFVRPAFQGERARGERNLRAEVSEGLVWLWRQRFLRTVTGLVAGTNFVHEALGLVLIVRMRDLGASAALIGAVFSILGAGSIVGALVAPRVQRRVPAPVVVLASLWVWPVQTAALFLIPSPIELGVLTAAGFVTGPIFNVVTGAYRYALVPERLYGRVASASLLFSWGSIPLGALFAGYGTAAWGAKPMLLVLAGILLAIALAASASRDVRNAPPPEEIAAPDSAVAAGS
ncbi:MAG TPA: MFS transporter [Gaiellaceae bacterium]|nr:MFS transporter [Gaiellaceae bacterium]